MLAQDVQSGGSSVALIPLVILEGVVLLVFNHRHLQVLPDRKGRARHPADHGRRLEGQGQRLGAGAAEPAPHGQPGCLTRLRATPRRPWMGA
jgi:hypothetical protein